MRSDCQASSTSGWCAERRLRPTRQVGGADHARGVSEHGRTDLQLRAVVPTGQVRSEVRANRLQQQVARLRHAATDDDHSGVENGGETCDALADPAAQRGELFTGERVTFLGSLGDERAGDVLDLSAGAIEQRACDQRAFAGLVARVAHQGGAARVLLPAAAVTAAADLTVGDNLHVSDLRGNAERAPVQLAVEHDPATDSGPDRDQQAVLDVLTGAEGELPPRSGVGVVLDDDRQSDTLLQVVAKRFVAPGEVGREQDYGAAYVDEACRSDANRLYVVVPAQLVDQILDLTFDRFRVGGR